jgi:dihydroneopterin aldolase
MPSQTAKRAEPYTWRPTPVHERLAHVTAHDVLAISGLETECVVGVYPHERDRPQPLRVDLDLYVDTEQAARSARLSRTVDYDRMTREIIFLLKSCRFGLIETAAGALASYVLAPPGPGEQRAAVLGVRLKLIKPQALPRGAERVSDPPRAQLGEDHRRANVVRQPGSVVRVARGQHLRVNLAPKQRVRCIGNARSRSRDGVDRRPGGWQPAPPFGQRATLRGRNSAHLFESDRALAIHPVRALADLRQRVRDRWRHRRTLTRLRNSEIVR